MSRLTQGAWLVAIVLLSACVESPTTPSDRALKPQFSQQLMPVQWQPMGRHYRDPAHFFATGRAGLATLSARALFGKDGHTVLDVSTGDFNTGTPGTQLIQKIQLKVLDGAGQVVATRNENGLDVTAQTYDLPGVVPGQFLHIQANVLVPNVTSRNDRTGVVTLTEPVLQRPDLKLTLLGATNVPPGVPATFIATVRELNGDVSARADCVLYVDGTEADRIHDMFVGEGDAVDCRFSYSFTSSGEHTVTAAAEQVIPGDWDMANNSASQTVTVRHNPGPLTGSFAAREWYVTYHRKAQGDLYTGVPGNEYWESSDYVEDEMRDGQDLYIIAYGARPAGHPLTLTLSITSDGRSLFSFDGVLPQEYPSPCGDARTAEGLHISACDWGHMTEVRVEFTGGVVVYAASGYMRYRRIYNGSDTGWQLTIFESSTTGSPKLPFGNTLALSLQLQGPLAAFVTQQSLTFSDWSSWFEGEDWACYTTPAGEYCYEWFNRSNDRGAGRAF